MWGETLAKKLEDFPSAATSAQRHMAKRVAWGLPSTVLKEKQIKCKYSPRGNGMHVGMRRSPKFPSNKANVTGGFSNVFNAFAAMLAGENIGKAVVKVCSHPFFFMLVPNYIFIR